MRLDGQPAIALRGDLELADIGAIQVIGASAIATELKGSIADADKRRELIAAIRAGAQVELEITARTFRQKDGKPNRRGLRFEVGILAAVAASFVGMPVLEDHNTYERAARIGTIIKSELYEQGDGWSGFRQTLRIVKPEAVISVLDGTLDRFSVGWVPTGPVLCSIHRVDVRSWGQRCCYPLEVKDVDGKATTVEWCFTSAEGVEVSAVNVPAVKGTKIEDIRSALDAEISLGGEAQSNQPITRSEMAFPRLAALLGLTALAAPTDEESALAAVNNMKRERAAAEQELGTTKAELATTKTKLAAVEKERDDANEAALTSQVDAELTAAYREGKLRYGRDDKGAATPSSKEARLRRIAKEDGLEGLRAELAEMDVVVPVGERVLTDRTPQPKRTKAFREATPAERRELSDIGNNESIGEAFEQLGLDAKDMPRFNEEV
jgi:hypothetical protein